MTFNLVFKSLEKAYLFVSNDSFVVPQCPRVFPKCKVCFWVAAGSREAWSAPTFRVEASCWRGGFLSSGVSIGRAVDQEAGEMRTELWGVTLSPLPPPQRLPHQGWPGLSQRSPPDLDLGIRSLYAALATLPSREGLKCSRRETGSAFIVQVSVVTKQYKLLVTGQHLLLLRCVT